MEVIEPLLDGDATVLCCGMVGSAQGWADAGYRDTPATILTSTMHEVKVNDSRLRVYIAPGVAHKPETDPSPDVMRGEETQVAALLGRNPDFAGTVCLPGTHTKWVRVEDGKIVDFKTVMTGELFDLLATKSILRHSIVDSKGWDDSEFRKACHRGLNAPQELTGDLFRIRSTCLISGLSPAAARARLSGFLLGVELAATSTYWRDKHVTIISNGMLSQLYMQTLGLHCGNAKHLPGENLAFEGLLAMQQQQRL